MSTDAVLHLSLRRQALKQDEGGHAMWEVCDEVRDVPAHETAIVICDMWDHHWSRGAEERVNVMAPLMNNVVEAARARGVVIVHAPSDTMAFYAGNPARERIQDMATVTPPAPMDHADPPLPIDDSDEGSDTGETQPYAVWSRQHPDIQIDQTRDAISDSGLEIYSLFLQRNIKLVFIMGVHTNMCVLHRSFGVKQMVRWGVDVVLVRDLTDTMYNPAMRPYVSHAEGTRLVVEFIEKFWAPTIDSEQLMR